MEAQRLERSTEVKLDQPTFPWKFLVDPNGPDRDLAVNWVFLHLRGKAYKGYLEAGRGALVGPFLTNENDAHISSEEAARRHASGQIVGLAVMYLPVRAGAFEEMFRSEAERESVREAINQYDPETQCVVLLSHDDCGFHTQIIGALDSPTSIHTPRAVYYRELLQDLPNAVERIN